MARNLKSCVSLKEARARWVGSTQRAEIMEQLADRRGDFQTVAAQTGKPDADPFDPLCHLDLNARACPAEASGRRRMLTRRQRADQVKKQQAAFFAYYATEAREILNDLLEKYATDGELQFTLPHVLKVPPIANHGTVAEIAGAFGGLDELRSAVKQLQDVLYAD